MSPPSCSSARALLLGVIVASVAACTATGSPDGGGAGGGAGSAAVTKVLDGDTIVVDLAGREEKVRLIGVDTPETHSPTKPVQCYGKEASARTGALLPPGTRVRLVRDREARDHYGRLLAYVYRLDDGLFVNMDLARGGFADVLNLPPNVAHTDDLREAVDDARRRAAGLWGTCGGPGHPAV